MDKSLYLIELTESAASDYGKRDFGEQCFEQKVLSTVWQLQTLVSNGGFLSYLGNRNSAEFSAFAPTALRAIGAEQSAAIVQDALLLRPASLPDDDEARWEIMGRLAESAADQFETLDNRYFAYPDDLTGLLFAYVAAHPEVFGPAPLPQ